MIKGHHVILVSKICNVAITAVRKLFQGLLLKKFEAQSNRNSNNYLDNTLLQARKSIGKMEKKLNFFISVEFSKIAEMENPLYTIKKEIHNFKNNKRV